MTERMRAFVAEYLVDLDAMHASIRAGYSEKGAKVRGHRLLQHPGVREAIDKAIAKRRARLEVKQDEVLRELLRIGRADIRQAFDEEGRLLPVHKLPEDIARAISGFEVEELFDGRGADREHVGYVKKVKFWDKNRALEMLAKHLGILKELVKHEGTVTLETLVAQSYGPEKGAGA